MALSKDAKDDLKAQLAKTRKSALNFGLSLASKPEDTVLIVHRSKKAEALKREAKKAAGSPKVACGLIESKGKLYTLTCADAPPSGTAKKLRAFFQKVMGISAKIQLVGPGGYVEEDGEDEEAAPQQEASVKKEEAPVEAEEAPVKPSPLLAKVEALLKKLEPRIKAASAQNEKAAPLIEKLDGLIRAAGASGDAADVKKRMAQLTELLTRATGSVGDAVSLVKLGKARLEWPQVRDQAMVDLGRLKDQIQLEYKDMPEASGEVTTALGMLDKSLAAFQIKLHERLDEVLNAEGDARKGKVTEARKIINAFNKHMDSDPVLGALDGNEILPDINITTPLRQKLGEISAALGA